MPHLLTVTYIKIIGIILVVMGHSMHEYPHSEGWPVTLYWTLYTFRMPLFIFASGLVMSLSFKHRGVNRRSVPSFAVDKFLRLMVPYFLVMLIACVPRMMLNSMADDPISLSINNFTGADDLIISLYWFLPFSFTIMLIGYGGIYLSERYTRYGAPLFFAIAIPIALALHIFRIGWDIWFFAFGNVPRLGIYFLLGMAYGYYMERVDRGIRWASPLLFVCALVLWLALSYVNESTLCGFACALTAIVMIISLVNILVAKKVTVLDHLAGSTYMIFLLSWFANVACQQVLSHLVSLPWWVYSLLSLTLGVYMPWLVYRWLINKNADGSSGRLRLATAFVLGHRLR